jgi:hypothetical protein
MKYEKPEIVVLPGAVWAIQGTKFAGPLDSSMPGSPVHTTAAFEADE